MSDLKHGFDGHGSIEASRNDNPSCALLLQLPEGLSLVLPAQLRCGRTLVSEPINSVRLRHYIECISCFCLSSSANIPAYGNILFSPFLCRLGSLSRYRRAGEIRLSQE